MASGNVSWHVRAGPARHQGSYQHQARHHRPWARCLNQALAHQHQCPDKRIISIILRTLRLFVKPRFEWSAQQSAQVQSPCRSQASRVESGGQALRAGPARAPTSGDGQSWVAQSGGDLCTLEAARGGGQSSWHQPLLTCGVQSPPWGSPWHDASVISYNSGCWSLGSNISGGCDEWCVGEQWMASTSIFIKINKKILYDVASIVLYWSFTPWLKFGNDIQPKTIFILNWKIHYWLS